MSDIDTIVLNRLKNNKFSSSAFLSYITKLPQQDVEESINRLVTKRLVYQSVRGLPRRFSLVEPKEKKQYLY